jgi:hypothetical protein
VTQYQVIQHQRNVGDSRYLVSFESLQNGLSVARSNGVKIVQVGPDLHFYAPMSEFDTELFHSCTILGYTLP